MKIWVKLGLLVLMIAVICANLLHASQPEAQHSNTTWPQVPTTSQDVTQPSPTDAVTQPATQPPTEAPTAPPHRASNTASYRTAHRATNAAV